MSAGGAETSPSHPPPGISDSKDFSHHDNQQHQEHHYHYDQSSANPDQGLEKKPRMARARSLGSAKFLFDRALDHHNSVARLVQQRCSSQSELATLRVGFGGGQEMADINGGGNSRSSNVARWGDERVVLRGFFSPYKLTADENQPQQQHRVSNGCDSYDKNGAIPSIVTSDVPRDISNVTRVVPKAITGDCSTNRRILLRPSTWLGPEVSPLQSHSHAGRLNSPSPTGGANSAAAAWPSPRRNGRWGGGSRGILGYPGSSDNSSGSNISVDSTAGGHRRGVRRQRSTVSVHQCLPRGGGTEVSPERAFRKKVRYVDGAQYSGTNVYVCETVDA